MVIQLQKFAGSIHSLPENLPTQTLNHRNVAPIRAFQRIHFRRKLSLALRPPPAGSSYPESPFAPQAAPRAPAFSVLSGLAALTIYVLSHYVPTLKQPLPVHRLCHKVVTDRNLLFGGVAAGGEG